MVKNLSRIGNSLGLIIDKPILELLRIDESTPMEVTTDGVALTIRPVRSEHATRVRESAKKMLGKHRATFAKLAK